ncbi:MAG: multicopper oxidase domain-containing protein [gamma proteobacterium endosymbiont of Lamellibrachia anaximandri]|nr:multicopper oxidase domain-containing protein [gamma proteobacterium endosymbiont of Lamellibrachia anaximandri]MBL3601491.1 multicopper oxidase domain-containing protein [gamma proteobacterium endosymbiont of Lamellibrachia anaximandri]MBL3618373.1 multicopper oxidase domain-containing protein [gamma proteobacterium endosymbiont of Lamellibrachia anaximandri]
MKIFKIKLLPAALLLALSGGVGTVNAAVFVQCPGDDNGNAVWDEEEVQPAANTKCMHLIAGDSFAVMSDDNPLYIFGYGDQTGTLASEVIKEGILDAEWPGPTVELEQNDEFYLSLTNVGTVIRPDLFDPHTIHFHGFPNASAVFDGVPEVSVSINMGATLTYYYNVVEPGTYIYHCHVEATEHMEMGMLANLYVHPLQDVTGCVDALGVPNGNCSVATRKGGTDPGAPTGYTYNDGDGTTAWDVEQPLQVSAFDSEFHDASLFVQPLPFAALKGDYPQINGRGYPDTINPGILPPPADNWASIVGADGEIHPAGKVTGNPGETLNNDTPVQLISSNSTVTAGQTLLLRLSNVGLDRFYTLTAPGLTMKIVGTGARHMRNAAGDKNLYREVASVNFGGGETHDVLVDTTGVAPGTYFLHATELHQMSNLTQLDGGMMTEIVVQ